MAYLRANGTIAASSLQSLCLYSVHVHTNMEMEFHAAPATIAWVYQNMLLIEAVTILRVMLIVRNRLISLGTSALTPRSEQPQI
jgi:hypothetical protein